MTQPSVPGAARPTRPHLVMVAPPVLDLLPRIRQVEVFVQTLATELTIETLDEAGSTSMRSAERVKPSIRFSVRNLRPLANHAVGIARPGRPLLPPLSKPR